MQLINCKIYYISGENKIYTTELKNDDYTITISTDNNALTANMQTSGNFRDFKIEFYLKIDSKFDKYFTNGYQTWIPSLRLTENEKPNKFFKFLTKNMTKGTGTEYIGEYSTIYDSNSSYGLCYFKEKNVDNCLIFASKDEIITFTKFNYDFERSVLKITRDFKGISINKNTQLINLFEIEGEKNIAFETLKNTLDTENKTNTQEKLFAYNTFSEFDNKISENIIIDKIHTLQNKYNLFIVGDGYSDNGYDVFTIDKKRFPNGMTKIVENIHAKEIKAGFWFAPFAISPLSKSYPNYQNLIVKENNKPVVTCPFWGGAFALDITNPASFDYLKSMFDLICNEWNFDVLFIDGVYLAGSVPHDEKTQAMLINDAIEMIQKLVPSGKQVILGGVPFLSAIGKCDYINISLDTNKNWLNITSKLSPEFPTSQKSNIKNLVNKKYMDYIYPCIYSVPNSKKIKSTLLNSITGIAQNIIVPDDLITPTTYPSKVKVSKSL